MPRPLLMLQEAAKPEASDGWFQTFLHFIDSPAPYSPLSEYLLLLFILWFIARRANQKGPSFDSQAQDVLDEKFEKGEISKTAYDKYRQDVSLRPKR